MTPPPRVSYRIFCWGGEKKITQGYSCQHLIKSLNKSHLVMCIVIEGPDLKEVEFNLDIFKDQNHAHNHISFLGGGGEIPGRPYPCMKPCVYTYIHVCCSC